MVVVKFSFYVDYRVKCKNILIFFRNLTENNLDFHEDSAVRHLNTRLVDGAGYRSPIDNISSFPGHPSIKLGSKKHTDESH